MYAEEFIRRVQDRVEVRNVLPLNFQMGFPAAVIKNEKLLIVFPYYAAKIKEKQICMAYSRYIVTVCYPSEKIIRLEDLTYNVNFSGIDFSGYAGTYSRGMGEKGGQYRVACANYLKHLAQAVTLSTASLEILHETVKELENELMEVIEPFQVDFYKCLLAGK